LTAQPDCWASQAEDFSSLTRAATGLVAQQSEALAAIVLVLAQAEALVATVLVALQPEELADTVLVAQQPEASAEIALVALQPEELADTVLVLQPPDASAEIALVAPQPEELADTFLVAQPPEASAEIVCVEQADFSARAAAGVVLSQAEAFMATVFSTDWLGQHPDFADMGWVWPQADLAFSTETGTLALSAQPV
jgi:hypothetical protein